MSTSIIAYKLILIGTPDSGYGDFMQSISEIPVVVPASLQPNSPAAQMQPITMAMTFGRLTIHENLILYIFATIPQVKQDFFWGTMAKNLLGSILLVNTADRDPEMLQLVRNSRAYIPNGHYFIVVNTGNYLLAPDPDELRPLLQIRKDEKFLTWNPTEPDSAKMIILELLKGVPDSEDVRAIIARIEEFEH